MMSVNGKLGNPWVESSKDRSSLGPFVAITFILPVASKRLPRGSVGKECDHNAGRDTVSIPGLGRFPGAGTATHSSILAWISLPLTPPGKPIYE